MNQKPKDRNETANRVFFGTGSFFTIILVVAFTLYLLYQLYIR